MERLIKRYENRKMYDTEEGSYVSLDDIKSMVRDGETIKVIDNTNDDDLTVQVLTQIVLEETKDGRNPFSSDLLHNAIRWSNNVLDEGIEQVKHRLDDFVPKSIQNIINRTSSKEQEFKELRNRVEHLEHMLNTMTEQSSVSHSEEKSKKSNN